jgi:hypothetical protein
MKISQIILERFDPAKILANPKEAKMLAIAFQHDHTIPRAIIARMGPKPSLEQVVDEWTTLLNDQLENSGYGDLSANGKMDDWLFRQYVNGLANWEDISGEAIESLGIWKMLSQRGLLRPEHQDFNRFTTLRQLQKIKTDQQYRAEIHRLKQAAEIEKMKKEKKDIELINNDRYLVTIPFNYGACYYFNNAYGFPGNFCTGSSNGLSWWNRYAPEGVIVSIVDKKMTGKDGKWQFHAPTKQIVNAIQDDRMDLPKNDGRFAKLFPGLMKKIVHSIETHAEEIKELSTNITHNGYNVAKEVADIKRTFPKSYESDAPTKGLWTVTYLPTNKSVELEADNQEDLVNKLTTKHPTIPITDYELEPPQ